MREPARGPGIGQELTVQQELACLLRILAHEGWQENLSGHITIATPDGGMWCNPWGIWWEETRASDILRLDADGNIVEGKWDVTPVVFLHTEIHRVRPDAKIVVHNHPYYATLLSNMREVPRVVHQNSSIFEDEIALVDEYAAVEDVDGGKWLAHEIGDASGVILAHHGAIVIAPTIPQVAYKSVTFERMCRFTYDTLLTGREPEPVPREASLPMKGLLQGPPSQAYWDGAVRRLLRDEPETIT
jgi:ribulose-5-phosphate 4-epimerase/fuculose-1-phosphate aldolase